MKGKSGKKRFCFKGCLVLTVGIILLQLIFYSGGNTFAKESSKTKISSSQIIENTTTESTKQKNQNTTDTSTNKTETNGSTETIETKESQEKKSKTKKNNDEESTPKQKTGISPRSASVVEGVTYNGAVFQCWSDGMAGLVNGNNISTGIYTVPREVVGTGGNVYKIIHIYPDAFKENTKITGLAFESNSNLEVIGEAAFKNCSNLSGTLSFENCFKLTQIDNDAFRDCKKITKLDFGSKSVLKKIGSYTFSSCQGLSNTSVTVPDSVRDIGYHAFFNSPGPRFSELRHKTVLELSSDLPELVSDTPVLPDEVKEYESRVDSSNDQHVLHKAAKWLDEARTTAEIRIDYGKRFNRQANLDVVFVLDHSNSMQAAAPAIGTKDNEQYNYHRSFYLDDIVNGAAKILLQTSQQGYDNRMALVAFSRGPDALYSTGFTKDPQLVANKLITFPNNVGGTTNYSAGLKGAIDTITNNWRPGRIPVVIFLSDGEPQGSLEDIHGLTQAQVLRDAGIRVYPIGIYVTDNQLGQNLKNISYDGDTQYLAKDSDSFVRIMEQVLEDVVNSSEPLDVAIEDVLSEEFDFTGDPNDIKISTDGGTATTNGKKITWDLKGCEDGVLHTLKIKVKLKDGTNLTTSGILPTNDSMGATDKSIVSNEQPKLDRYLLKHEFINETNPGEELPEEIKKLKPGTSGGYADGTSFDADNTIPSIVDTADGQRWEFLGWDDKTLTINGADITFIGRWRYLENNFSFIKLTKDSEGLPRAEFSLYVWTGEGQPTNRDLATEETIAAGKWKFLTKQNSQSDGRVDFTIPVTEGIYFQLAETKAPDSYRRPTGQWRFTIDANGLSEGSQMERIAGPQNDLPPAFIKIEDGQYTGYLGVMNETTSGNLPNTGGRGRSAFALTAAACWITGLGLYGVWLVYNRKK